MKVSTCVNSGYLKDLQNSFFKYFIALVVLFTCLITNANSAELNFQRSEVKR